VQFKLGESVVWLSNARNNFAPFAGFMLMGYEKQMSLRRAGEEIDKAVEEVRAGSETPDDTIDNVPPRVCD